MNRKCSITVAAAMALAGCATQRAQLAGDDEFARTYGPARACDYTREATLETKALGEYCYKIGHSDTPVAEIVDETLVPSLCPVVFTWVPGFDTSPKNTCKEIAVIALGDEFKINHWRSAPHGSQYQLVYRSATGKSHAPIKLLPDMLGNKLLGFWGKDMKHEYHVFLEYSKADADHVRKYWRMEVFQLGDACIAEHKAANAGAPFKCADLPVFDPELPGQGSEGGGVEPPPR